MVEFCSPCEGEIYSIEKFPDEIIADRVMGDGFYVEITGNTTVAPFDGEVSVLYPTGHAICLTGDNGVKMMIHIGADTYKLEGLNKPFVKVGDKVKKGDLLIQTDIKKMKKKTGNNAVAVVFLGGEKVYDLKEGKANCLDLVATLEEGQND